MSLHEGSPTAIIVGGSSGSGRVMALRLASNNHKVVVVSRKTSVDFAEYGLRIVHISADLSQRDDIERVVRDSALPWSTAQSLLFFQRSRAQNSSWDDELNVSALATKSFIEAFAESRQSGIGGSVVIVTSIAANYVAPEQPVQYHVAKAAQRQIARFYAASLGPRGIRVNCVAPASVLKPESAHFYLDNEELMRMYRRSIPRGKIPTADEICNVVEFLMGHLSTAITGQEIVVDAGATLYSHEAVARMNNRPEVK